MKDNRVTVDCLKQIKLDREGKLMNDTDITEDITDLFWLGIKQKLIKGERLTIVCRGQTTKGKSTLGLHIKYNANQILLQVAKENKLRKRETDQKPTTYTGEKDEFNLIAANQIEFLRIARQTNLWQVFAHVDEFSKLAESGANATTESNLMEWYNNVCAQRYIHTIYCTPDRAYDHCGVLIHEVIDVDKEKQITKTKLYYNNPGDDRQYLLGYCTFNVSDVIEKKWYKTYQERKNFAQDLTLKEGFTDIRPLEFSLVALLTYKKCENWGRLGLSNTDIIATKVEQTVNEIKGVYSLVCKGETTGRVRALLVAPMEINKTQQALTRERTKPLSQEVQNNLKERIKQLKQEQTHLLNYHKRLIQIYLNYSKIGTKELHQELKNHIMQNGLMQLTA